MCALLLLSLTHSQSFSWEGRQVPVTKNGAPLQRSLEDQVLLEVDVARFTTGPDAEKLVPPERQGRFLGLLDRMKVGGTSTHMSEKLAWPV
jgi:hypothetical protein